MVKIQGIIFDYIFIQYNASGLKNIVYFSRVGEYPLVALSSLCDWSHFKAVFQDRSHVRVHAFGKIALHL